MKYGNKNKAALSERFRIGMLKFGFGLSKRIGLYEKIGAFLDGKHDLVSSLRKIRDRYAIKKGLLKRHDPRADILSEWLKSLDQGLSFGEAIAEWVPPGELMLIEAGERGGGLVTGLQEAVVLSNAAAKNKAAIIGGVAFPLALGMMLIGFMIMFQIQMVPIFKGLLAVEKWPAMASTLNTLSGFFYNNLLILAIVIAIIAGIIGKTMGTWTKPPREIFDMLPPWNIYRSYQASSFLIAMSSLMRAGVPAFDALKAMSKNASPWMMVHLTRMMKSMSLGGGNIGAALDTGLLDEETAGDVQDYSSLGSFSDAIYVLGARSLDKGIETIQARMAVVKNLLLVAVAVSILWIYFASFFLQMAIGDSLGKPPGT